MTQFVQKLIVNNGLIQGGTSAQVGASALAPGAVVSGIIASGAVTPGTLASGAVTSGNIASGTVDSNAMVATGIASGFYGSGLPSITPVYGVDKAGRITSFSKNYLAANNALNPKNVIGTAPGTIGGIFDGASHPLSNYFSTLAVAQAAFPNVTILSLNAELDRVAVQNAYNLLGVGGNPTSLYIPGTFAVDFPVWLNQSNTEVFGDNWDESGTVTGPTSGGPAFFIAPSGYTPITLGAALATGAGGSYPLTHTSTKYLNFAGLGISNIIPASTNKMTLEFFLQLSQAPPASVYSSLVRCSGKLSATNSAVQLDCFALGISSTGLLQADITIAGVQNTLTAPLGNLTSLNTPHHVAMMWFNGSITIWVDGIVQGFQNFTAGNITTAPYLDLTVGQTPGFWPDYTTLFNTVDGFIDSIRISRVGQYNPNTNFTPPTAKLPWNNGTGALCNFDQVTGPFCGVYNNTDGLIWTWQRDTIFSGTLGEVSLHDININATGTDGIVGVDVNRLELDHIKITGAITGIKLWRNCFEGRLGWLDVTATTAAVVISYGGSDTNINTAWLNTSFNGFGLATVGSGGSRYDDIYLLSNYFHIYDHQVGNSNTILSNIYGDIEAPGTVYFMYLVGNSIQLENSNIFYSFGTNAPIIVDNIYGLELDNVVVTGGGGPGYVIGFVNTPSSPVYISPNSQISGGITAWSNQMQYIMLGTTTGTPLMQVADASGISLNLSLSNSFYVLMTEAVSSGRVFSVSNPTVGQQFQLLCQQPSSGAPVSGTFAFLSGIFWQGGKAPNFTSGNNNIDGFAFTTLSGANSFYGTLL